jgi:hypothetical protein
LLGIKSPSGAHYPQVSFAFGNAFLDHATKGANKEPSDLKTSEIRQRERFSYFDTLDPIFEVLLL